MQSSLLSWIGSFLTLYSVVQLTFVALPNEMQLAIMAQVGFCNYVESLKVGRGVPANTEVGMAMLAEVAEEERTLGLEDDKQRARKQWILTNVRTFVRFHSELPIGWGKTSAEELGHWAKVLEASFETCSSYSESPTWKKACMAGLFGRNTLVTLLPHLSENFCSDHKALLLQTALFIGDIDSLEAIIDFFELSEKDVLEKVPEFDLVFSGCVDFFNALLERLPNLMEKRLGLIREASSLNRLDLLTRILEVAEPVEPHELDQILDSFWRSKMFKYNLSKCHARGKLHNVLEAAAQHGHLPIIRFLWPAMDAIPNSAGDIVRDMMVGAGSKNHRSVLEFLLWQSGGGYMEMAQRHVNNAFEAAVGGGYIELMDFFRGKDDANNPVAPGLGLVTLSWYTLYQAIAINRNWDGIQYLVLLKKEGDTRFADFELVDQDNTALCLACEAGNYDLVEYLLRRTDDGQFVLPYTNPAARDNLPLLQACCSGSVRILEMLLERDISGNYIYKVVDPSLGIFHACNTGHMKVVEFFLKMEDGKYVLPGMEGVDLAMALRLASRWNRMEMIIFFLTMKDGKYVLPEMNGADVTCALLETILWNRMEIIAFFLTMKDGKYVVPEMNGVDFTCILLEVIKRNRIAIMEFLLRKSPNESYLLPGFKVTEEMLTIAGQSPEMTNLLRMHLG